MNRLAVSTAVVLAALLSGCNDSDQPNVAPELGANNFVTETDVPVMDKISASDTNGDSLTFSVASPPQNGGLMLSADGHFTYTPNNSFTGSDSFTVAVSDGELTANGQVTVDIAVAVVSFLSYSRAAFAQTEQDLPLGVNGRDFTQDATSTSDYADLLTGP